MYECKQSITLGNHIEIPAVDTNLVLLLNVKDQLLKDMHYQICDKYIDAIPLSFSEVCTYAYEIRHCMSQ